MLLTLGGVFDEAFGPELREIASLQSGLGHSSIVVAGRRFRRPATERRAISRASPTRAYSRKQRCADTASRVRLYVTATARRLGCCQCPGFAAEFPRWAGAVTSLAARWRGGFEHNANFQNRWYLGIAPVFEFAPAKPVSVELGLNVSVVLLRSLWHPFHFDEDSATWDAGEDGLKFASEVGAQGGVWWRPELPVRFGVFYGFSVLYPVSPENDLPLLPLTKLGLAAGWTF
jgi:hypothetical protein